MALPRFLAADSEGRHASPRGPRSRTALGSTSVAADPLISARQGAHGGGACLVTALSFLIASQAKTEGFRFDDSLLYAFNGIESLRASRFDGTVIESTQVSAALEELKRQVPKELRGAINPRLATTRDKRTREKIEEILGICGEAATTLQAACPELASVPRDARNAVAHTRTEQMGAPEQVDVLAACSAAAMRLANSTACSTIHPVDADALLQAARRNPRGMRFADLAKLCDAYFGEPRQKNTSHRVYRMPWAGDPRVNIQSDKGMAKRYQVQQVLKAVERLEEGGRQ